jgi:hypothetical protein
MAVLLGDGLAFAGHSDWQVGDWTCLLIFAYVKTSSAQVRHRARLDYIQRQLASAQSALHTRNAAIGHIVLETFKDSAELQGKLDTISNGQKGCQA